MNKKTSKNQQYLKKLIKNNLHNKYYQSSRQASQNNSLVCLHLIESIVNPQHYGCRYRIKFQEIDINARQKQYLKRYYIIQEYVNKNQALTQYYKFHQNYPYHLEIYTSLIMINYQELRNKQQRKVIKKLMNQPSSISEMEQNSDNGSTFHNRFNNNQYSLKLKQLNLDNSSILLQSICDKINIAFQDVKPLYFYRGKYQDGVQQFKKFMLQKISDRKITNETRKFLQRRRAIPQINLWQTKDLRSKQKMIKQHQQKLNKNQFHLRGKIDINKKFRRTLNITNPNNTFKSIKKGETLPKIKRNRTATTKIQSFSKTTQNQNASKQQYTQQGGKKRGNHSVRIRNYKSINKVSLDKCKSNSKLVKLSQMKKSKGQNESKHVNIQTKSKQKLCLSKSKRVLKRTQQKPSERSLIRQDSKPSLIINNLHKQQTKFQLSTKQNTLNELIKNKLKLRA